MDSETELYAKRFAELSRRADDCGFYTYTEFLTAALQEKLVSMKNELPSPAALWGGHESCERRCACFGRADEIGYDAEYPIVCVRVEPKNDKFAKPLSHRDYLGALMSLGIKRETVGDIFTPDSGAYIFCCDTVAPWICRNLESVGSVAVKCSVCEEPPEALAGKSERVTVNAASERLDVVLAAVWKLSRSEASKLVAAQKVAVNSLLEEDGSRKLREGDRVSARGFGKFIWLGVTGTSKKGRLFAQVDKLI